MKFIRTLLPVLAALAGGLTQTELRAAANADSSALWPGMQPDGSMLLPNQWSLRPAGTSLALDDFPVNLALSPDGKFAAILHCGFDRHGS